MLPAAPHNQPEGRMVRIEGLEPIWSIWVPGRPKAGNGRRHRGAFMKRVRAEAVSVIAQPSSSCHLGVEVWFRAPMKVRADVDNVAKPILDALKGIAYVDDKQVRSIFVVALPGEGGEISYGGQLEPMRRLIAGVEFLINIYDSVHMAVTLKVARHFVQPKAQPAREQSEPIMAPFPIEHVHATASGLISENLKKAIDGGGNPEKITVTRKGEAERQE